MDTTHPSGTYMRGADGRVYQAIAGGWRVVELEDRQPSSPPHMDSAEATADHIAARMVIEPGDQIAARMVIEPGDHLAARMVIEPGDQIASRMVIEPGDHIAARMVIEPGSV